MVTMNGEECHNEWEITFEEIHATAPWFWRLGILRRTTATTPTCRTKGCKWLWLALGPARALVEHRGAYVMLGVTGPNEYENNVNNNWYTNHLAAWCLKYAAELVDRFEAEVSTDECDDWKRIAEGMCLPQQEGTLIRLQQDGFLDKDLKPTSALPEAERPINQVWSWDRILRSCFIKQADVLQGFYFFPDDFTEEELKANFDFYEPMTVHESSLSPCVHSIWQPNWGARTRRSRCIYVRLGWILTITMPRRTKGCTSRRWQGLG